MITSDADELNKRLLALKNKFNILMFLQYQGMNWIDVVMSGNNNEYFLTNQFIALYNGENN